jgi:hypothetical protein
VAGVRRVDAPLAAALPHVVDSPLHPRAVRRPHAGLPMLRLLPALLLVSCAAAVPPRADPGDPRVLPMGAVAELDGSFSEGDELSFAWSVEPVEGALLQDAESAFATLTVEAPGFYTLRLEVCDAAGRCDVAETWARVDDPARAGKLTDFGLGEFAGVESGAGALGGPNVKDPKKCAACKKAAQGDMDAWVAYCRDTAPSSTKATCYNYQKKSASERTNHCYNNVCDDS